MTAGSCTSIPASDPGRGHGSGLGTGGSPPSGKAASFPARVARPCSAPESSPRVSEGSHRHNCPDSSRRRAGKRCPCLHEHPLRLLGRDGDGPASPPRRCHPNPRTCPVPPQHRISCQLQRQLLHSTVAREETPRLQPIHHPPQHRAHSALCRSWSCLRLSAHLPKPRGKAHLHRSHHQLILPCPAHSPGSTYVSLLLLQTCFALKPTQESLRGPQQGRLWPGCAPRDQVPQEGGRAGGTLRVTFALGRS